MCVGILTGTVLLAALVAWILRVKIPSIMEASAKSERELERLLASANDSANRQHREHTEAMNALRSDNWELAAELREARTRAQTERDKRKSAQEALRVYRAAHRE